MQERTETILEQPAAEPIAGGADSVQAYLQDIGRIPLLTAEEEIALARQIEEGSAAARETLITANLRLVVSIARKYAGYGLTLDDLIQAGNMGLLRAAAGFDWRKGFRFSTYAETWIRSAITHALSHDARTIRVPSHVVREARRFREVWERLAQSLGAEPNLKQVAEALEISEDEAEQLLLAYQDTLSIDTPTGREDETTLRDQLPAEAGSAPGRFSPEAEELEQARRDLATLPERQRLVLEERLGLIDGTPKSLQELAGMLGVTPERVRQIEVQARDTLLRLRKQRERTRAHHEL
jgi:RNA polymerase primary sigma factor